VRWDSSREIDDLQSEMNRLFGSFFGRERGNGGLRRWMPAMDLVETEDHLVLRADLPGIDEEDVEIEVQDGVLTVSGERKAEEREAADDFYRVERAFGTFSRSVSLPHEVDAQKISANFDRGVLEVRIPKPEQRQPHRVRIGAGAIEGTGSET
jgi:HSP20 family protein